MNVKWLIEKETFSENLEPLLEEIKRQGFEYKMTRYVPFEGSEQFLTLFAPEDCVVVYGSLQLARQIQKVAKWVPGVYCNLEKYACTSYYPAFGEDLLNYNYIMLPFGELLRRKEFLFKVLGNSRCLFVRPSSGFKLFTGKVVKYEEWEREIEKFGFYDIEPNQVVVVAEPQNLAEEWRFVVVDGVVVSGSQYHNKYGSKLDSKVPKEALEYAKEAAKKYSPDRVWTLDICRTSDYGEYFVLEIGCFSSAGLYVCPMEPIVQEVSRIAHEEWLEHM